MTPTTIKTIRGAIEAEISATANAMDEAKRQVEHAEHRARMATSDATVAAQELTKFRQYEDCRLRMNWNTIRIEEGKNQ